MNATYADASAAAPCPLPSRLDDYIAARSFDRPTLVLDPDRVQTQYTALKAGLGRADIHYAVKANPAPAIIDRLVRLGSGFDAASRAEIELCLAHGARPEAISFGNTVKRAADIAFAHQAGLTLFAADAPDEVQKIATHAPGASVYIRLLVGASGADWPLTRKFGAPQGEALDLLDQAHALGLNPVGLSFHVGSQTRDPAMWAETLDHVAATWAAARARGHRLELLNIGGGFPADYGDAIPDPTDYAAAVLRMIDARFPSRPRLMAEPGRAVVADAGLIVAEVLLTSRKSADDLHRWVYLDIGKFSGLAETIDEAIRYQITTPHDGGPTGPCILAGPSCDSADVLYEKRPIHLPLALTSGDRVVIRNAGAYTSSYASVGFNGFPPLDVVVI